MEASGGNFVCTSDKAKLKLFLRGFRVSVLSCAQPETATAGLVSRGTSSRGRRALGEEERRSGEGRG